MVHLLTQVTVLHYGRHGWHVHPEALCIAIAVRPAMDKPIAVRLVLQPLAVASGATLAARVERRDVAGPGDFGDRRR